MANILDDKRAVLLPYIDAVDHTLAEGIRVLKYWQHPDATACETKLLACRAALFNIPATREELKHILKSIAEETDYACHLYASVLGGDFTITDVDSAHEPDGPSVAQLRYQEKIAKSLEAKQKRAPGFDGAGGGVGRRTGKGKAAPAP